MSWLTYNNIRLLLNDSGCRLDLLSLLWITILRLTILRLLIVRRRNGSRRHNLLLLRHVPRRLCHTVWLLGGSCCCDALNLAIHINWAIHDRGWWLNKDLLYDRLRAILLWVLNQCIEFDDLILRILISSFWLEISHDERDLSELILA